MNIPTVLIPGADWLPLVVELAAKATLVLGLTAAAAALLWRSSAALRHMVWCVGVVGVLALPLLSTLVPAWELPLLPASAAPASTAQTAAVETPAVAASLPMIPAPQPHPIISADARATPAGAWLPRLAAAVIASGVLVGLLWLAAGFWGVARLGRRAEVVRDPEWLRAAQDAAERLGLRRPVLLLRSRSALMPATWGLLWPSVVLPSTADRWPDDRRRAVLAHELAHVKRFDCLTQALAQVVCVLLWWHPAVWYAARRLRVERERACDDLVLGAGARASDYAAHLLEIARAHRALRLGAPALVSMAKPSQLESRLLWVLDEARARSAPSMRATLLSVLVGLLVVGPLSAMRPTERAVVRDASVATATPHPVPDAPAPVEETEAEAERVAPRVQAEAARAPAAVDTIPRREIEKLIAMRSVGVNAAYINALRAAGYSDLSADDLTSMKAVGVSPRYIAEMNAAGFGRLTPDQLVEMRAVGVTPAYLAELRRHGYTALSIDQATDMRAVGVTGAYIEEMNRAGFGRIPAKELVSLRALGVTTEYLRELGRHGLTGLTLDAVEDLRGVGVTGEYITQMKEAGLHPLDARTLVNLRAVGVTPAYIREMSAAGFGPLTAEQLVRLRTSGVDRELIRSRSGTKP